MTAEVDAELLKIAKRRLVGEYLEALGSTPEQAETAALGYADQFSYSGAVLGFKGELAGTPEMETKVREWFTDKRLDFLVSGKKQEVGSNHADAALVAAARSGNLTAKGKLFVAVGRDQSKLNAILSRKAFNEAEDEASKDEAVKANGGKNPWATGPGFNLSEQGRIYRANPALAANLAKAAGKTIGTRS